MATMAEFGVEFTVNGSRATLAEMEKIIKKLEELNKASSQKEQTDKKQDKIDKDNLENLKNQTEQYDKLGGMVDAFADGLWIVTKRLFGITTAWQLLKKTIGSGFAFANMGQQIKFSANSANMSTREFQKWGYVAKKYGGNENSIASAMQNIDMQIENAKYGQVPMQEVASRYGITLPTAGSAQDFLKVIAKKMESMDRRSQLAMGRAFGFDEATIRMLQLGLKGLTEELAKAEQKAVFNEKMIKEADEFNKNLAEMNHEFQELYMLLGRVAIPLIKNFFRNVDIVLTQLGLKGALEQIGVDLNEEEANKNKEIIKNMKKKDLINNENQSNDPFSQQFLAGIQKPPMRMNQYPLGALGYGFVLGLRKMFETVDAFNGIITGLHIQGIRPQDTISSLLGATVNNDVQIVIDGAQEPAIVAQEVANVFKDNSTLFGGVGFSGQDK